MTTAIAIALSTFLSTFFGFALGIVGTRMITPKHADTRPLYDNCPDCGATMIPGLPIEHELGCRYGLRVEWVVQNPNSCGCTSRDCHTGQIVHERGCRFDNTLTQRIN